MRFVLEHRHTPSECAVAHAAWKGHADPPEPAVSTCRTGGHEIHWIVDADDAEAARALLPEWVATRTSARRWPAGGC